MTKHVLVGDNCEVNPDGCHFNSKRAGVWFVLALVSFAAAAASAQQSQPYTAGDVSSIRTLPNGIEVTAGAATMRVLALRDDVLRVRLTPDASFPEDASWAVLPAARTATVMVTPTGSGFRTSELQVVVERAPFRLLIEDAAGKIISEDAPGFPAEFRGTRTAQGQPFRVYKTLHADEHIFGLGDKTGPLDRRDEAFVDWNTDAFAFQESTDPIYKSVPFYLAETGGRYYGLYLDNTWRTAFDFGRANRDVTALSSDGGPVDYYILAGPKPRHVVESYAWLTGLPPLPPLWSFGFQQSRYSYTPAAQVRAVADRLRADRIPADALWLDIDFEDQHRSFAVDAKTFPDMPKMLADLRAQHFHVIAITDVHLAASAQGGYKPYESGKQIDAFLKTPGGEDAVAKVWPGESVFPDLTRPDVREWFGGLYKPFVRDGFAGYWDDMNEPATFEEPTHTLPLDTVGRIEGDGFAPRTATQAEIHNVYGLLNARATYEGVQALEPGERPFVMYRATFAGGQRYGVTWTGDNSSTWNHLTLSSSMLVNLGLSGFAFAGADVGGFSGSPSPELLTKWLEVAAFEPIDRDHSNKKGREQEVWVDGPEQEAIRRHFIETRYRLMPYLYSLAEEASRTGVPMMRPLFLEFPEAMPNGSPIDTGRTPTEEFLLGPDLLVAPAPYPDKISTYRPFLPGAGWFDFWSGRRVPEPNPGNRGRMPDGEEEHETPPDPTLITPALDRLPVYVRPGSILPMQAVVQSTDEVPAGPIEIHVYPAPGRCEGSLYTDDGHSLAYENGDYLRIAYGCVVRPGELTIRLGAREGSHKPWWSQQEIVVHGWTSARYNATLDGGARPVSTRYDAAHFALHVVLAETAGAQTLHLSGYRP